MDHVFGVLQREDGIPLAGLLLLHLDGFDDPVEAVGLAGGAIVGADDLVHPGAVEGGARDLHLGGVVVGIGADEDIVVGVVQAGAGGLQHGADHRALVPCRDQDGDGLLRQVVQFPRLGGRIVAALGDPLAQRLDVKHQIHEQVVQAAKQIKDCKEPLGQDHWLVGPRAE
jgi:hypothetical protein